MIHTNYVTRLELYSGFGEKAATLGRENGRVAGGVAGGRARSARRLAAARAPRRTLAHPDHREAPVAAKQAFGQFHAVVWAAVEDGGAGQAGAEQQREEGAAHGRSTECVQDGPSPKKNGWSQHSGFDGV